MTGQGVELRQYYRAVVKRLWLVALLTVVIAGGIYWRTSTQPTKYSTASTLLVTSLPFTAPISSVPGGSASGGSPSSGGGRNTAAVTNDIVRLASSTAVAERVAKVLGLKVNDVRKALSAEDVNGTDLVMLKGTSTDREMAQKLANASAQQFIAFYRDVNQRNAREIRLFIERQLAETRARLEASDRAIAAYKQRNGFVDLTQFISSASTQAAAVETDQQSTRLELREIEAKLAQAAQRLAKEPLTRTTVTDLENSPVFQQVQSALTKLEIDRAELSQRYTPLHPKMVQLESEVAALKARLTTEARTILGRQQSQVNPTYDNLVSTMVTLEIDRAAARARLGALGASRGFYRSQLSRLTGVERELQGLIRENGILDELYGDLSDKRTEALLREQEAAFQPAGVTIAEAASLPFAPEGRGLPLRTGIGALAGLLLGMMAAIFLETSDDRIRGTRDAERTLGAPVLAEVPDMAPPRVAPTGTALLIGVVLMVVVGGSVVVARTATQPLLDGGAAVSVLHRLGSGIDTLSSRLVQAIR